MLWNIQYLYLQNIYANEKTSSTLKRCHASYFLFNDGGNTHSKCTRHFTTFKVEYLCIYHCTEASMCIYSVQSRISVQKSRWIIVHSFEAETKLNLRFQYIHVNIGKGCFSSCGLFFVRVLHLRYAWSLTVVVSNHLVKVKAGIHILEESTHWARFTLWPW